jgi:hypothetical protein
MSIFELGKFFKEMGVAFNSQCYGIYCNGAECRGKQGTLTMTVNGQPTTEFEKYIWKDGDVITITFD